MRNDGSGGLAIRALPDTRYLNGTDVCRVASGFGLSHVGEVASIAKRLLILVCGEKLLTNDTADVGPCWLHSKLELAAFALLTETAVARLLRRSSSIASLGTGLE